MMIEGFFNESIKRIERNGEKGVVYETEHSNAICDGPSRG